MPDTAMVAAAKQPTTKTDERRNDASGSVRLAGSINFKGCYAPEFPLVRMVHVAPGRTISQAELEELGVVAAHALVPPAATVAADPRPTPWAWPNHQRCLDGAPLRHDGSGRIAAGRIIVDACWPCGGDRARRRWRCS